MAVKKDNVPVTVEEREWYFEEEHKENRTYKDTVFVDLFYDDETAKQNLLSLYNALHDTDYHDEKMIQKIKVESILYKNFYNDISFALGGKMLVFGEHQSSVNNNMPLRCLMYSGRVYEQAVNVRSRYKRKLVKIPAPEFYIFYNGTEDCPQEQELFLSDAYINPVDKSVMELKVKVININLDKSHKILEKCSVLKEYSQFVDTVRKYTNEKAPIKQAVLECIQKDILADYLRRKGSEVINMLIAEYDYEMDMEVAYEEAYEEATEKITKDLTEKVTKDVTEKVTKDVTEKVTKDVTEKVTKNLTEKVTQDTVALSGKIFQSIRHNPEFTDHQISEDVGCDVEMVMKVRKAFNI